MGKTYHEVENLALILSQTEVKTIKACANLNLKRAPKKKNLDYPIDWPVSRVINFFFVGLFWPCFRQVVSKGRLKVGKAYHEKAGNVVVHQPGLG